jgi:hypothetical protein
VIGQWEGSGTFKVTGFGIGSVLGGAAVVAVVMAVVAIIAAIFWILIGVGVVLLAIIAGLVVMIRRSMAAHRPSFTVQAEVIREPRPQVPAAQPQAVVNHYHLHLPEAGAKSADPRLLEALRVLGTTRKE